MIDRGAFDKADLVQVGWAHADGSLFEWGPDIYHFHCDRDDCHEVFTLNKKCVHEKWKADSA